MRRIWWCVLLLACGEDAGETAADAAVAMDVGRVLLDVGRADAAVVDAARIDVVEADAGDSDAAPRAACSDGRDNDRDGRVDFPDDPGCVGADDDDETDPPPLNECADRVDNDGDGRIDSADPDCTGFNDRSEMGENRPTACSNGLDDDEDGAVDFPFDPGCPAAGHNSELDPSPPPECANGADDDGDGAADFPADPGCVGAGDEEEAGLDPPAECADGVDNDESGSMDWPEDPGCDAAGDLSERGPCGAGVNVIDLNAHLARNDDWRGDLNDASALMVASCGGNAGGEFVFRYVVDRHLDRLVFDTNHEETEAPVVMYLRDRCLGADLQCLRGRAGIPGVALTVEAVEPGAYFVVVDTGNPQVVGPVRLTVTEVAPPHCRDSADNDEDGLVDAADPGCAEADDPDETDPAEVPVCANGEDDDGDGLIDWPNDPDCLTAGAPAEAPPCAFEAPIVRVGQDGAEFPLEALQGGGGAQPGCEQSLGPETVIVLTLRDPSDVELQVLTGDGMPALVALYARNECDDAESEIGCRPSAERAEPLSLLELDRGTYYLIAEHGIVANPLGLTARVMVTSAITECNDQIDNDDDGLIDLADVGCERGRDPSELDPAELPECADGIDNDENGQIDWPDDDGCVAQGDLVEDPPGVALGRDRGFGHHGSCDTWNQCMTAQGCAEAACAFFMHGPPLSYEEGRCQDLARMIPGLRCSLFRGIPNNLDQNWANGCNIPVVYDVVCAAR